MRRPAILALTLTCAVGCGPAGAASHATGLYSWVIAGKMPPCAAPPICGDGPDALSGRLGSPSQTAVDIAGNLYIADTEDGTSGLVRRVSPAGALTTLTTSGTFKRVTSLADQPLLLAGPSGIAVSPDGGTIYVAVSPSGSGGYVMRIANGVVSTYAGSGAACAPPTPCGDGGPAAAADLAAPYGLALDGAGNLYIADHDAQQVREVVAATGRIRTIAGTGSTCAGGTFPTCGDGGAATDADLHNPSDVALSADGTTVFIADTRDNVIRAVHAGTITTVAGTGHSGACGCAFIETDDNVPATSAGVVTAAPEGIGLDQSGNLFIAETGASRIREVDTNGDIHTIAGAGLPCVFTCGVGQAVGALYSQPSGVVADGSGGLFVTDSYADQIYWLTPAQPLGIPGPKGDKGDTGAAGANGAPGATGPAGHQGAHGGESPLASWTCRHRRAGLGRNAVDCFARVFGDDGHSVSATLARGGRTIDSDSATARNGIAKLHLSSRVRIRGAFVLRISERSSRGVVSTASLRVAI